MIYSQKLKSNTHQAFEWNIVTTLLVSLGLACFVTSLFLISLFTSGEDIQGSWILLIGWLGLLIFQFSWYANPLNLLALLYLHNRPVTSFLLSSLALALATQTFLFVEIPTSLDAEKVTIKELGLGFYIWYLAQFLFLTATVVELLKSNK